MALRPWRHSTKEREVKKLLLILCILSWTLSLSATTRYIAQTAGTFSGGTACNGQTAITPATFNGTTNNPDDVNYVCGTLTFAQGTSGLTVVGSGTNGHPVTLKFDTGASLQSPQFLNGGGAGGGIVVTGDSYVVIDGGTPCGWNPATGSSQGTCNGFIENTNNGTAGSYTYQNATIGIEATCSTHVTIQNIGIYYMYRRTSTTDSSVANNIFVSVDGGSVDGGCKTTYLTVQNSTFHDASWHLTLLGNNITVNNNNIYNMDHGLASGAGSTGYSGLYFFNNHVHDTSVWDDTSGADSYHHDGLHLWGTSGVGGWSNIYIYNNQFDGNAGTPNAWIYFEYVIGPSYLFNNTFTSSPGSSFPSEFGPWGGTTTQLVANNTVYDFNSTACANSGSVGFAAEGPGQFIKNNIFAGQYLGIYLKTGAGISIQSNGIDYNIYGNNYAACGSGGSGAHTFSYLGGQDTNSLSTWQSQLPVGSGQDLHSQQLTAAAILLNANLTPQSSSPVRGAGANLYSTCNGQPNPGLGALCSDYLGVARPTSAAWDAGAIQYNSGTTSTTGAVVQGGVVAGGIIW